MLAHVRKATQGPVALVNCHPFQREWGGKHWLFCHNGHLKNYAPPLDGSVLPVGQTDSERAFCWLLQEMRHRFGAQVPREWEPVATLLQQLVPAISSHGVFNFLLTDGRAIYAHASTHLHWVERQYPFPNVRLVDCDLEVDLASANGPQDRMVLLATKPLTHREQWHAFAPGELRVFVDGRSSWTSAPESSAYAHAQSFVG